ncbi:MAG: hypothetical protein HYT70_01705 [Candidatus Aenigmarchaeota archaeon]|nr:hypothetical protein [Candidatus Aenigmarchaeota archaeon]
MEQRWYRVVGDFGHRGSGKSIDAAVFIYAKDPTSALQKYHHIPGFKRRGTYSITPLTDDESIALEQQMSEREGSVGLYRDRWYYDFSTLPEEAIRKLNRNP